MPPQTHPFSPKPAEARTESATPRLPCTHKTCFAPHYSPPGKQLRNVMEEKNGESGRLLQRPRALGSLPSHAPLLKATRPVHAAPAPGGRPGAGSAARVRRTTASLPGGRGCKPQLQATFGITAYWGCPGTWKAKPVTAGLRPSGSASAPTVRGAAVLADYLSTPSVLGGSLL